MEEFTAMFSPDKKYFEVDTLMVFQSISSRKLLWMNK